MSGHHDGGTFDLLGKRRFLPLFVVQFLAAFNDNVFKNSMLLLLAYRAASETESGFIINLGAGLFILPFLLFSQLAGQLCDKYEKSKIMRLIKVAEIAIMAMGAVGFFTGNKVLLFATLFFMGCRSAIFGPVKYSILPQHLKETELIAGNSLVEMGTFLAILVGTIAGGMLAGAGDVRVISAVIIGTATLGYLAARSVPEAPATSPGLRMNWNIVTETGSLWKLAKEKEGIFNSILGISWFWYFGATILTQMPTFAKHTLGGNEGVVTLLLAVFSISIGVGSVLCERLSRGEIELGLVPIGAAGMTLFICDLFFVNYAPVVAGQPLISVSEFLAAGFTSWRILFDLAMFGITSSLFIVPLYALIQHRSDEKTRSRVIAANNVFNAIFMVASAGITMAFFKAGLNTVQVLFVTALMNAAVCAYIFALIPEFFMRFVFWVLASTVYRMRYEDRELIPRDGAAVIVANHVSFIDWFIITAACRRPVRFVMDHHYYKMPIAGFLFRAAKAIPIAPEKEDAALKEKAFERISAELRDGQILCIFPEGRITKDGTMNVFKPGVERILARDPVLVVPMAIKGMWGSWFSRKAGKAMAGLPKPSNREVTLVVGPPLAADAKALVMEHAVADLLGEPRKHPAA